MSLRGAIFDMDGVIVDNIAFHSAAWKKLGVEMGRNFTDGDIKRVFGKRNREILMTLTGGALDEDETQRWGERKEELYRAIIEPELRPVSGLPDFLNRLRTDGIRTAVATSGPPQNVNFVLQGLRLEREFDAIITGLEAPRSKPDPGIFLLAAERLGLPPSDCVVFEDSPPGIQAAKAAGCVCVGVATTHPADEIRAYGPDKIIRDFRGFTLQSVLNPPPPRSED